MQIAELTHHEKLQQEQNPKPADGKSEPAKAATPAVAVAQAAPTASKAAASQPVAALSATPAETAQKSVFQRVLGSVGLNGQEEAKADPALGSDGKLEEISPKTVTIPLPPRRQAAAASSNGPQASTRLPAVITDSQKLAPGTLVGSGFNKLD